MGDLLVPLVADVKVETVEAAAIELEDERADCWRANLGLKMRISLIPANPPSLDTESLVSLEA